ncbi:uncharacterized protein LOC18439944 isoform X1 [Amborella trichopoda]|uniref:uncharacterized protein LOC18439944 isoform X1 n=1 Tax=Amborella trichopoda TaxID=13333 RepID=UPI0009C05722|nr:uncharacterized protein LOC18439944 isoform X1 [Amborella trichopoda]XP_020526285.1 uncharacterized protein LOC18439944 isoform X1 [Amborella trichopoda]XP_020526286.1 uncharacterized protein LOC18439944 isoform X1 [Amborella trichopoda]|eukprot:XP_020526284.1 uncharacterized protein LOC18439944 isoform X1 [Amborella trichopoda]
MAPAQMITGVEQESMVENSIGLEGAKACEILNSAAPKIPCEENLECTKQSRETNLSINDTSDQDEMNKDMGCDTIIDIEGNEDNGDVRWSLAEETTECSSSFGDTLSSLDDDCKRIASDQEVESRFHGENGFANVIDEFNGGLRLRKDLKKCQIFSRKKKLTADWKKYRNPVMWRCHWLELRIKELQSQASKYDRLLLEIKRRKRLTFGQVAQDSSSTRVLPFSAPNPRLPVKKRQRRKKVEDTIDMQYYMALHPLFSYYEKRKKPEADAVSVDDDCNSVPVLTEEQRNIRVDGFGASHVWVASEMGSMETSPEQLLWRLEGLQSRILKLKGQLNKVMLKNVDKFSSMENSIDRQASTAQSPQVSPVNGDSDPPIVGLYNPCHDILDFGRVDLGISGSGVSGSGVSGSYMDSGIPDFFGIYSDADVPFDPPHIGDACEDLQMLDEVLIENQAALGEDLPSVGKIREEEIKEEEVKEEERGSETAAMGLPEIPLSDDGFTPESESLKTKRKRALRRGASRGWNVKGIRNNC